MYINRCMSFICGSILSIYGTYSAANFQYQETRTENLIRAALHNWYADADTYGNKRLPLNYSSEVMSPDFIADMINGRGSFKLDKNKYIYMWNNVIARDSYFGSHHVLSVNIYPDPEEKQSADCAQSYEVVDHVFAITQKNPGAQQDREIYTHKWKVAVQPETEKLRIQSLTAYVDPVMTAIYHEAEDAMQTYVADFSACAASMDALPSLLKHYQYPLFLNGEAQTGELVSAKLSTFLNYLRSNHYQRSVITSIQPEEVKPHLVRLKATIDRMDIEGDVMGSMTAVYILLKTEENWHIAIVDDVYP